MKTIYALLIGINEYNDPRNNLGGCVRDVQSIQTYFETHFNDETQTFVPLVLTDKAATRANIIAGFDHYKNAKDGDICLFHYSGHGSYCPSPKAFSHIDVNGKHQTLVCHDSRAEGGRDLLDKELSYLIWKATKDKDLHFLAIMDCCHSGSNTRSDYILARRFSNESKVENPLTNYLGIEDYAINDAGQYTPPVGDHIQLAAASALETAKEVFFQGKSGGVFTYCLLELLKEVQNNISYSELINRIRIRIRNVVREQSPQLDVTQSRFKGLGFLSNLSTQEFSYLVSFEKTLNNWVLNAGALHGIATPNKNGTTIFNLEVDEKEIKVDTVFPHYSTVNNLDPLDRKKTYKAKLISRPSKTILIGFDPDNDQEGEKILSASLKENPAIGFDISVDLKNSQYLIHAKEGYYFLTKLDALAAIENQKNGKSIQVINSLFKKVKNYEKASAKEFFQCVEKLAKWKHVLELGHANSSIQASEIKVSFAKTNYHSTKQDIIPVVALDTEENSTLNYEQHEGGWCRPAFKLNLENRGERDLWVSLLYLSSDFGINNILISKQKLEPGQNVSASYVSGGTRKFIIPVKLEDYYLENNIDTIQEYLKVFICTEEFETGHFNQTGIPFDRSLKENNRSLAFEAEVNKSDWTTKDIEFTIHRALEPIPEQVPPVDRDIKPSRGWFEESKSSIRPDTK